MLKYHVCAVIDVPTPCRASKVGLLFLCDTLNTAFDIAFLYNPLVNNFGAYTVLLMSDHSNACGFRRRHSAHVRLLG